MSGLSARSLALCTFAVGLGACLPPAASTGAELAGGRVVTVVHEPSSVNAFVIDVGGDRLVLVDTGVEPEATTLLAALTDLGRDASEVEAIFLTHGHTDHAAGAATFPEARLFALAAEEELVAGREAPERPLPSFSELEETGLEVTDPLADGDVVVVGESSLEVFALPGHTPGSAAYLVAGVLFLGDAASANGSGDLDGAPWIFSTDTEESDDALAALYDRLEPRGDDVEALAFGHSAALSEGLAPLERFAAAR